MPGHAVLIHVDDMAKNLGQQVISYNLVQNSYAAPLCELSI